MLKDIFHKRNCFILNLLFLLLTLSNQAQEASDKLSEYQLNEKFLEHLIKEKINEVRLQHNLKPLFNDSILFIAAKFHANYLFTKGELSHTEPENKEMETPQKRAEHFGAVNYLVGENVAFTLINKPVRDKKGKVNTNTSYEETATDLVTMWVNSPGHYKNIITPDYNTTGLAIWVDAKTNRVYAVQKFATILYKYDFNENKTFFSYSNYKTPNIVNSFNTVDKHPHLGKHAYNLKAIKDSSKCNRCFENSAALSFGRTSIIPENGNIYLCSYDPAPIFNLLKKRKDGFAAELVFYKPFDCGNPEYYTNASRRNKQCIFNGKILKPIYRKKALRGFKPGGKKRKQIKEKLENGKIKKYYLKLGKLPKNATDYFEINLAVIQKKRVCQIMHFSSFCGDTLERFYALPFQNDSIQTTAELKEDYKNISFTIPFQKNKTDYKLTDIKPFTDSLLSENFSADTIAINAFSSIEGKETINTILQQQRAKNIANAISSNQKEKLITQISNEENWYLFEKQIREQKELIDYKNLTRQQIKTKLEDTLQQKKIEKYLSKQRTAKIRLHARIVITDKIVESYLLDKVKKYKRSIALLAASPKTRDSAYIKLDSLHFFMEIAYTKIKAGVIKLNFFKNFDIGNEKMFNLYNLNKTKFKIQLNGIHITDKKWAAEVYEDLVMLYNNGEKSFFINYNMLNLVQMYGKEMKVEVDEKNQDSYVNELLAIANNKTEKELAEKIGLNFWFKICRLPSTEQPDSKRFLFDNALLNIYNYFKGNELTATDLNKLGLYYLYHSKAEWVVELLYPEFEKKKYNPEGLKILAKTMYQNYEETGNAAYYEFLKKVYQIIGKEDWCPMFVGPCNISFQAFDYENFRNFYCEKCNSFLNYAKDPKNYEKK